MLTAGSRLGPYEVISTLGAGGMGEVYRARDTRLDRRVAIKVLPPELAFRSDIKIRFLREASAKQGETATTTGGIASTAKGIGLAKLESHAGSLLSHIPGLGGMAAAAAVDAGTSKVAGKIIGVGSQDWLCTVLLDHGHYSSANCGLINRPIGG